MSRRTRCKKCRKPFTLALEVTKRKLKQADDPYCSAECCRSDHGIVLSTDALAVYQGDGVGGYRANSGLRGSYAAPSTGAPTRRQLERLQRDVDARAGLGLKPLAEYSPRASINREAA